MKTANPRREGCNIYQHQRGDSRALVVCKTALLCKAAMVWPLGGVCSVCRGCGGCILAIWEELAGHDRDPGKLRG